MLSVARDLLVRDQRVAKADMAVVVDMITADQRVAEWAERQLQHFQHQLQQLAHNQLKGDQNPLRREICGAGFSLPRRLLRIFIAA
jgi:hypothetical protein